jgi:hypothetical protein
LLVVFFVISVTAVAASAERGDSGGRDDHGGRGDHGDLDRGNW